MSADTTVKLIFSLSFADLVTTAINKSAYFTRDLTDLTPRGITEARITALDAKRTAFVNAPSIISERETTVTGFADRDTQATVLRVAIREIRGIAQNTFGSKSPKYKGFDIMGLSTLSPMDLYIQSGNVVVKGNASIALMGPKGLTVAMLANVTTQANSLLALISATPILTTNSEQATANRHTLANDLFTELTDMCQTAHTYYESRDELKAANYIIYDVASKVVDRDGIVPGKKQTTRKTADVDADTIIRIKVKTGTSLQCYYGMTGNSLPGPLVTTVDYNPVIFTQTTAAKLGFDDAGGIRVFIIRNPNEDESEFLIKIGGK